MTGTQLFVPSYHHHMVRTVTWPTDQPKEFWDACFLVLTLDYRENYKPYLIILCDRKPKRNRTTLFYIWITIQNTHLTIINNKSTQPSEKTPRAEYMQYCISQSKRCISESMIIHQHKKNPNRVSSNWNLNPQSVYYQSKLLKSFEIYV